MLSRFLLSWLAIFHLWVYKPYGVSIDTNLQVLPTLLSPTPTLHCIALVEKCLFSISSTNSVETLISYHPCLSIARWLQECAFLTHSNPVPRCRGSQKPGNCLWACLCVFLFGFVGVIGSLSFCVFDTLCVWESIMEPWIILHFPFAYELPTPNILHSYSCLI